MSKAEAEQNFRRLLQDRLLESCRKNPQYSLRSFARSLDVSPSALSAMLNGKRPITSKMKLRLGSALGLTTDELMQFSSASSKTKKPKQSSYHLLELDLFAVISDWYHYAILELTKIKDFDIDTLAISKKLGITKSEANFAVERLKRLGFLAQDSKGKWIDATPNSGFVTNIQGKTTSLGSKKLQTQILEKSIQAIEQVSLEKRNHTSMTMAINSKDLEYAFEQIKKFRRNLCNDLESSPDPDEVYQLHIGFYPVTKKSESQVKS